MRDRGSVSVELALLSGAFFVLVAIAILFGKLNLALAQVESVARSAARDISLARNTAEGVEEARAYAEATLGDSGACSSVSLADTEVTDTEVTVRITCTIDLSEAALVYVPGSKTYTIEATEVIDQYRERES